MNCRSNDDVTMGARIQRIRLSRDMTQEALAEKLELSTPQQVSEIERGLSGLSLQRFVKLCEILEVDADYLLFGKISPSANNSQIDYYLSKMTEKQRQYAEDLLAVYAKSCGIEKTQRTD